MSLNVNSAPSRAPPASMSAASMSCATWENSRSAVSSGPRSESVSTVRNSRQLTDRLALVLGLGLGPLMAYEQVGLDLLWTGVIAGTAAYGVHRLRETWR